MDELLLRIRGTTEHQIRDLAGFSILCDPYIQCSCRLPAGFRILLHYRIRSINPLETQDPSMTAYYDIPCSYYCTEHHSMRIGTQTGNDLEEWDEFPTRLGISPDLIRTSLESHAGQEMARELPCRKGHPFYSWPGKCREGRKEKRL